MDKPIFTDVRELAVKEGFSLDVGQMTIEQSRMFINLTMMANDEDFKDKLEAIMDDMAKTPSIFAIAHKRWEHFKLQDKIDRKALLMVEVFAEGNPGKAVFMMIDMLCLFDKQGRKVTMDDISMEPYPMGFYTSDTVQKVVEGYVKTGLLANSELY